MANPRRLRYPIVTWIEHTYNHGRRERALGKLTPVEFELAFIEEADASMISRNHHQQTPGRDLDANQVGTVHDDVADSPR